MIRRLGIVLFAGVLLLVMISSQVFAKRVTDNITVRFANIKLILNGEEIQTSAEPFIYDGNVYAPVATIANALNVRQWWDNDMPAVQFSNTNYLQDEVDYYYNSKAKYSEMGRIIGRTIYMYEDLIVGTTTLLENSTTEMQPISYDIPALELPGYEMVPYRQSPITSSFVQLNKFIMTSEMRHQETDDVHVFLHLLSFDHINNEVISLGSKHIGLQDYNITYTGEMIDHKLYLNTYHYNVELKEKQLIEINLYIWDQVGQIELHSTFTQTAEHADSLVNSISDADYIIKELLELERDVLPSYWYE